MRIGLVFCLYVWFFFFPLRAFSLFFVFGCNKFLGIL